MKVSVVIPTFNRGWRIERAVKSVVQNDGSCVNEIIVVDDGSNDGSCDKLESLDDRVTVIKKRNTGAAHSRLVGIEAASQDLVSFLDSDDSACLGRVESLVDQLIANPECVLSFGDVRSLDGGRRGIAEQMPEAFADSLVCSDPLCALLRFGCFVPSMNLCVHREIAVKAARSQGLFPSANDYDIVLGFALNGAFVYCPSAKIECERLEGGISLQNRDTQMAYALIAASSRLKQCKIERGRYAGEFRRRAIERWPTAFLRSISAKEFGLALRVLGVGIRYGISPRNLRQFYWSWDHQRKQRRVA